MTTAIAQIHRYYSPNDLYNRIIDGLIALGTNLPKVTPDDLRPADEFHIRGHTATKELIELAAFTPGMHVLDVGCGIGGSTRRLSYETRCRVTGIDLSNEYIHAAERLTQLLGMQDQATFHACSALELPFDDNHFDGAWALHMSMNIEDKLAWIQETCRVLKPGARAVFYEVFGNRNSPLYFPVPWAQDDSTSFLVPAESFRELITSAGFDIAVWNVKTDLAQSTFTNAKNPVGEPTLPALGIHLLVGNDIQTKTYNLHRNLDEERVSLIEAVAVEA